MVEAADLELLRNDSWADAPLGEAKYGHWQEEELYFVLPAVCCFLSLLRQTLPQAEIYCLLNTDIKSEILSCMRDACERLRMIPVNFDSIDKRRCHPTVQGMNDIKRGVLAALG